MLPTAWSYPGIAQQLSANCHRYSHGCMVLLLAEKGQKRERRTIEWQMYASSKLREANSLNAA